MTAAVELWVWSLDAGGGRLDRLGSLLDPAEEARAVRYVRESDRQGFILARGRLREILAGYTGDAPAGLRFAVTGRDKPVLPGGPAFNLSHAGGFAALAVAPGATEADLPLGIDIEAHRSVEPAVARLSFSTSEQAALAGHAGPGWTGAFFRCWTRKEAVIKALGVGLYMDLGSFDVTLDPAAPARLTRIGPEHPPPERWQMAGFELSSRLPGALAAITGGAQLRITVREAPDSARPGFCF